MATITAERTTAVFHLVRFVDGTEVPYTPYRSDCAGCCAPAHADQVPIAADEGCCCHH